MKAAALVLSVLTLNVAGPRRIHQGWQTRRAALTERLKAEHADAAAFQDIWRGEDLAALSQAAGYRHSFLDPALGLAVASRFPLELKAARDLGWGGGVLCARLTSFSRAADIYSARLTPGDDAPAAARRLAQLFDLAEFIRAQSTGAFVLLGDLAAPPDDPEIRMFIDLLGTRDLCVSHGDETCGRTLGDHRVDYVLIPYSSRTPLEKARAAFTETAIEDDGMPPLSSHFGLTARLDASWLKLPAAAEPEGRIEALLAAAAALNAAGDDAEKRSQLVGWIPWQGTFTALKLRAETSRLNSALERVRTALARAARPAPLICD